MRGGTDLVAALALAAALIVWPGGAARWRVRPRGGVRAGDGAWRPAAGPAAGIAALAALVGVAVWVGVAGVLAGAMVVATLAFRRRAQTASRLAEERSEALVQALDVLIAHLRVGIHPGMACALAALECADTPMGPVLERAAAQAALGGAVSEALSSEGTCFAELDRVASVWALVEQHGIAMGEMLEVVRRDLVGRQGFRRRVFAGLAGPRATAMVLALLPVVGVGLGQLMGAAPLGVLLGGGLGGVLLVVGVGLDCAGLLWAERIGRAGAR